MMGTEREDPSPRSSWGITLAAVGIALLSGCGNPAPEPGPKIPRPQAGAQVMPTQASAAAKLDRQR